MGAAGVLVLGARGSGDAHEATGRAVQPIVASSVALRPVDGGPKYYAKFPASLPSDPSYFPVGVWFESVHSRQDVEADKRAGLNLYVNLTADSDLPLIARSGMKVIAQPNEWAGRAKAPGSEAIAGWMLGDEVDMRGSAQDGFREMQKAGDGVPANDGRLRYANYGKGVAFWNTDPDASRYVSRYQDVVSADNYWFTDQNICGLSEGGRLLGDGSRRIEDAKCHRAANYGRTVDRVRRLVSPRRSRPVWNFVEVGHPFSEDDWPSIRPAQVAAAVWSGIIHGARGVVYFNHSFGGPAETQHALRETAYAAVRRAVARTNARVHRLAPVLNAPFADGFVRTSAQVDTMAKALGGRFYVFAGSRGGRVPRAALRVPCTRSAKVTVLGEHRSVRLARGVIKDSFRDGNAVHIYRIAPDSGCQL